MSRMSIPVAVSLLLLFGMSPTAAQAPPLDLEFGRVFIYQIGESVETASANAIRLGDRLFCEDVHIPELPRHGTCQPEGPLTRETAPPHDSLLLLLDGPPLPAYTLYTRHDTITFIGVTLESTPALTRPRVESQFDSLGARVMEGRSASGIETEYIVWQDESGHEYAELECRSMGDSELCTLHVRRVASAEEMDRRLQSLRRRAPLTLRASHSPPA